MNQLRSEDSNQRQRVGMFMPLSMTGQVFLQLINARKGAGASDSGDAVTPGIGALGNATTVHGQRPHT